MGQDAPYDVRDDDTGKLTPKYEDSAFLKAVEEGEMVTTQEVADEVGCHLNSARKRLAKLEEDGEVVSKKLGGNYIWMLAE